MLVPRRCPVCDRPGPAPCGRCIDDMRRAPSSWRPPPSLDDLRALVVYDGAARRLLTRLKYGNARASVPWLGRAMADLVRHDPVDVVTWVPTTGARRRSRGYDQARILARAVARQAGLPCRRLLHRRPGPAQTGQSREARWHRPAFGARPIGGRVLVVDDIVTTGATMAAAAQALRTAGADRVIGVAAAVTLLKASGAPTDGPGDDRGRASDGSAASRRRPPADAPDSGASPATRPA